MFLKSTNYNKTNSYLLIKMQKLSFKTSQNCDNICIEMQ